MSKGIVSRRTAVASLVGAGATSAFQEGLTAGQVIDRIKSKVGVPWRQQTVDNIIAGTAETPVKGIATTMMATFDVIQRASAAGRNLVITHEPTFYSHQDSAEQLKSDPTYLAKMDFIEKNKVVVFRFHDHWHARRPDGINAGMAKELGWEKRVSTDSPRLYVFDPPVTLSSLAQEIERKLNAKTLRVVGDPELRVGRVSASWGYASQFPSINIIARPNVDVLLIGEAREWELVEYVQDMVTARMKKGLIVIGHIASEQAGMKLCAEWLKEFIPELPIDFVPASEPFWSTGKSVG